MEKQPNLSKILKKVGFSVMVRVDRVRDDRTILPIKSFLIFFIVLYYFFLVIILPNRP